MPDTPRKPSLGTAVMYRDPFRALDWLEKAFGFERTLVVTDSEGNLGHSQMNFGNGYIMVASEWADWTASPASVGGRNTQFIHVHLEKDIDGHCERARKAGAEILQEPEDQFYGDRTYRARDFEGHVWTFGQTVKQVSREEMEKQSGLKIEGWA
ncbi:MAG: VOC family protein [Alphaproteobacteria bacterium]